MKDENTILVIGEFDDVADIIEPPMSDEEKEFRDVGQYQVEKEDTICWRCCDNKTCKYAWDAYNTDGDCLADK